MAEITYQTHQLKLNIMSDELRWIEFQIEERRKLVAKNLGVTVEELKKNEDELNQWLKENNF